MEYWEKPRRKLKKPADGWVKNFLPIIPVFHYFSIPVLFLPLFQHSNLS